MYFITFSRQMGAGGTEVAREVANRMEYELYDTEAIEKAAEEMGFLKDVKEIDEKPPSFFMRFFTHRPEAFVDRLYAVIYELAKRGNAIFLGRGGNMLFRPIPCALHVRVIASKETRVEALLERGFKREAALAAIERSDYERAGFVKFAFGRNWDDPRLYDVVLNMDNLTVDVASSAVVAIARTEEIRARSADVMTCLETMGLTVRVQAALAEGGFPASCVAASLAAPGRVRLTGVVQVPWEKTTAGKVAAKVKGVDSVENDIQVAGH